MICLRWKLTVSLDQMSNLTCLLTNYGDHSFSVNGSVVWNCLPHDLRSTDISLSTFITLLLIYLLTTAPCRLWELCFFVRIGPIRLLAGCRKRRLKMAETKISHLSACRVMFDYVGFSFWGFLCISLCISLGFLYLSWLL